MPALTDVRVDWVSLVDRPAVRDAVQQTEPSRFLLWKRETPTSPGGTMTEEEKAALKKAQDDLAAALATIETQKAEIAEIKKAATPEPVPAAINKDELTPAVRAALEKAEADAAALQARVEKAETDAAADRAVAKAERDERLTASFITKAEAYKALPVEAAKFGPVLKSASEKLTKDEYDELERVLKAADEQAATSDLFKEHGRGGDGAKADSAYAEVAKRASEIRKSDSTITQGEAETQVLKADPALARRLHDED